MVPVRFRSTSSGQGSVSHSPDAAAVAVPFAAIVLAMLPAVLDHTILFTTLPTITTDLRRLSDVPSPATADVVVTTAAMPPSGQHSVRHQSKQLLESSLG